MTTQVLPLLLVLADESPEPEDVVAGWTAFVVFIALAIAVAVLGFSLVKRLRNAERSEEEGRYDPSTRRSTPTDEQAADEAGGDDRGDGPEDDPR